MSHGFLKLASGVCAYIGFAPQKIAMPGKANSQNCVLLASILLVAGSASAQNPQHWMEDLRYQIGNLPLNQLAIPGTHDSGTYSLDPNSLPSIDSPLYGIENQINSKLGLIGKDFVDPLLSRVANGFLIYKWADAQDPNDSFTAQLNAGIRYFDIRPCLDSANVARVCHSLYGDSISDLVSQVRAFSLQNTSEIIILDFNHIQSHGFGYDDSVAMATEILNGLTSVTNADMIIPHQRGGASQTLTQILTASRTARVIVLYDDPTVVEDMSFNTYFWPGQGLHYAQVYSPWPSQDTVAGQIAGETKLFEAPRYHNGAGDDTLFVLQTNVTPDTPLIGSDLINQVESGLSSAECNFPLFLCPVLDGIRSALGWPANAPPGLHQLADEANTANYDTRATGDQHQSMLVAGLIEKNLALRQNLNIIQADWFGEMYAPGTTTVTASPFVSDMIKLNLPPQPVYVSPGLPWYSPYGQIAYGTSQTVFTLNASDVNWGISSVYYSFGTYNAIGQPGVTFTLASSPTPLPDGYVRIYFGATNNVGLSTRMTSGDYVFYLILDNTPPVVSITTPATGSTFVYNGTDVLNYSVDDGAGSGVKSFVALIDGKPAPASGQPFLAGLSPGVHTFTVSSAVDQLGNTAPPITVTFTIRAPG
jgi:hypothetical protein